ncbi:hypothetical protein [Oceanobacillus sp. J11TS1]|uniref:hypothetical protein n=1 Tax=Oceanobacillus sp. J11TS1 TaxID=2807191 RepID=UPI001B14A3E1|nr:hypothetical protein [Oceanobacillus sp. J11TS1]GIO23545.1 hypothetical protein J11TS1_21260 [Oceanobacillus sp. J11TS1]
MRYVKYSLLFSILICLVSCTTDEITEEDLIGGEWIATAGYKDGKPEGESYCSNSVSYGLEFKDEETVYSKAYGSDFYYELEGKKGERAIYLEGIVYRNFYIEKISEDEIGLIGNGLLEGENCYLERQ